MIDCQAASLRGMRWGAAGKVWVFYLTKAGLAVLSALCETALYQCAPHVAWLSAQSSCMQGAVCCSRAASL